MEFIFIVTVFDKIVAKYGDLGDLFIRLHDQKIFYDIAFPRHQLTCNGPNRYYIIQSEDGEIDIISNCRLFPPLNQSVLMCYVRQGDKGIDCLWR